MTLAPRMPSSPPLLTLMRVRLTPPPTLVRLMPGPVELWIAPPVHVAADVHVPALPVTVRPPLAPVVFSTMPLAAPFDAMLWNVASSAWIAVLAMFSAVAVVVASVLVVAPARIGHGDRAAAGRGERRVRAGGQREAAVEADRRAGVRRQRDAGAVAVAAVGDVAVEVLRAAAGARHADQLTDVVGDGAVVGDRAAAAVEIEVDPARVGDGAGAVGREGARAEAGDVDAVARAVGRVDVVERERRAGGAGDVDRGTAGRVDVGGAGRRHGDGAGVAEQEAGAARGCEREVAERRRSGVVLVGLVMLTPPLVEPVTVMASNVLVPMLTPVAPPPVTTRPGRRRW